MEGGVIANIRRFVWAAHRCACGCFNAYQQTEQRHKYLKLADEELMAAWVALPKWLKWFLIK